MVHLHAGSAASGTVVGTWVAPWNDLLRHAGDVTLGTTPAQRIVVNGMIQNGMALHASSDSSTTSPDVTFQKQVATNAATTAVPSGAQLGQLLFKTYDSRCASQ